MSFECAGCHEYLAGCGTDPPQFCSDCDIPTCATCGAEFVWPFPECECKTVHGEWPLPIE